MRKIIVSREFVREQLRPSDVFILCVEPYSLQALDVNAAHSRGWFTSLYGRIIPSREVRQRRGEFGVKSRIETWRVSQIDLWWIKSHVLPVLVARTLKQPGSPGTRIIPMLGATRAALAQRSGPCQEIGLGIQISKYHAHPIWG